MMQRHSAILLPMLEFNKVETKLDDELIQYINMSLYDDRVLSLLDTIGYELPLFPIMKEDYSTPVRQGISFDFLQKENEKTLYLKNIDFEYTCDFLPFGIKDTNNYNTISKKLKKYQCYIDTDDKSARYWFSKDKIFYIQVIFEDETLDEVYSLSLSTYESPAKLGLKKEEKKKHSKKRKTLVKDFEELLEKNNLDALKKVFDTCDIEAYGGYGKQTALAFCACSDEFTRWLIEQGADINAQDHYKNTPLHSRVTCWDSNIKILIELSADINYQGNNKQTPLHYAATSYIVHHVETLLAHGANVNAVEEWDGYTPLELALRQATTMHIEDILKIAELLLGAGAKISPNTQKFVASIGKDFEFYKSGSDMSVSNSDALKKLYKLFNVTPIVPRKIHDGISPIILAKETPPKKLSNLFGFVQKTQKEDNWKDNFNELWEYLVPASGPALTIQGELIRISGRINDEIHRNGCINWDSEYKKMAESFIVLLNSNNTLSESELKKASKNMKVIKSDSGDTNLMMQQALHWVIHNPNPIGLPKQNYNR